MIGGDDGLTVCNAMLAVVLVSAARKNSMEEEEERRVEKSARLEVMDIFELSEILLCLMCVIVPRSPSCRVREMMHAL